MQPEIIAAIVGGIAIICAAVIKKLVSKSNTPKTDTVVRLEERMKKIENDIVKNHSQLDEVKLDVAYIRGKIENE